MSRDAPRLQLQADQAPCRSLRLDLLQRLASGELALVELHGPAQARFVRVDGLVHVVAPEAQRGLQARRIARTEACRQHAGRPPVLEDRIPDLTHSFAVDEQLEAILACVAGA